MLWSVSRHEILIGTSSFGYVKKDDGKIAPRI